MYDAEALKELAELAIELALKTEMGEIPNPVDEVSKQIIEPIRESAEVFGDEAFKHQISSLVVVLAQQTMELVHALAHAQGLQASDIVGWSKLIRLDKEFDQSDE